MTEPTPGYSSPGPNTVIGVNPLDGPIHATLWAAVHGHGQIVAAIVNHAEAGHLKREIRREAADRAAISRGNLGGAEAGSESPAASG